MQHGGQQVNVGVGAPIAQQNVYANSQMGNASGMQAQFMPQGPTGLPSHLGKLPSISAGAGGAHPQQPSDITKVWADM